MRRATTLCLLIVALLVQAFAAATANASFEAKQAMQQHCADQMKTNSGDSCCDDHCAVSIDCQMMCIAASALIASDVPQQFAALAPDLTSFAIQRVPSRPYTPLYPPPIS